VAAARRAARGREVGRAVEGVDERRALELLDLVVGVRVAAAAQKQKGLFYLFLTRQTRADEENVKRERERESKAGHQLQFLEKK
jgi:hypothetical protein